MKRAIILLIAFFIIAEIKTSMFQPHPDDPTFFCIQGVKNGESDQKNNLLQSKQKLIQTESSENENQDPSQQAQAQKPALNDCYQSPELKPHFWDYPHYHISLGQNYPQTVTALIEIPQGSRAKFEVDYRGYIKLDRILHSSIHYPAHYGFIPQTLCGDRDPLDILVLCNEDVPPMTLIEARVIGAFHMYDSGQADDQILAVSANDPMYDHIHDLSDIPLYIIREIKNFFEDYQKLEQKVVVVEEDFRNRDQAWDLIMDNILTYQLASEKSGREGFTIQQRDDIESRAEEYYIDHKDITSIYTMDDLQAYDRELKLKNYIPSKRRKDQVIKQNDSQNQINQLNEQNKLLEEYLEGLKQQKNQKQKSKENQKEQSKVDQTNGQGQNQQKKQKQ